MSDQVQDFELKYEGNVVIVHLVINTDQDLQKLSKNLQRIAKGPRLDAYVCWGEQYIGEEGAKVWKEIQKFVTKVAADPKSKPFSLDEK